MLTRGPQPFAHQQLNLIVAETPIVPGPDGHSRHDASNHIEPLPTWRIRGVRLIAILGYVSRVGHKGTIDSMEYFDHRFRKGADIPDIHYSLRRHAPSCR